MNCRICGKELEKNSVICKSCNAASMEQFASTLQDALTAYLNLKTPPAFALCVMLPGDNRCHWVTNVKREDAANLLMTTGAMMRGN